MSEFGDWLRAMDEQTQAMSDPNHLVRRKLSVLEKNLAKVGRTIDDGEPIQVGMFREDWEPGVPPKPFSVSGS